jgi:hypothetical protein
MNPSWMQYLALFEISITSSMVIIWLLQILRYQPFSLPVKMLLLVILANLFFWPLGMSLELPLAGYVRGVTGDLSIVSTLLLWSTWLPSSRTTPRLFKWGVVIVALSFYPFALGIGMIDPYAWGYGSIPFFVAVLLCALICGLLNWVGGVWIIGLAIIAWSLHLHESSNLWDYLLDPFLAIWAGVSVCSLILGKRRERARSGHLFRPG